MKHSHALWFVRFLFTGPLSHYFYLYLEQLIPSNVPFAMVKRLLLDRLVVAPPFLLLFFFVMNLLEVGAYLQCVLKSGYRVWCVVLDTATDS